MRLLKIWMILVGQKDPWALFPCGQISHGFSFATSLMTKDLQPFLSLPLIVFSECGLT